MEPRNNQSHDCDWFWNLNIWSTHEMVSRILFLQLLHWLSICYCLVVSIKIVSSNKYSFRGGQSKQWIFGKNNSGLVKTRIVKPSDEQINTYQFFFFKGQRTRCRFSVSGCPFQLPSMELHEDRECKYRPTRCPSLTCPVKSPFIKLLRHLEVCTLH